MEDIIDVYERPYARKRPVVCLDEKPLQLLGEVREPLPMRPGAVEKIDAEYKRNGTCSIFAIVEPLTGHQHISVRERRTALDWAEEIQYLCDVMYPRAERIVLGTTGRQRRLSDGSSWSMAAISSAFRRSTALSTQDC